MSSAHYGVKVQGLCVNNLENNLENNLARTTKKSGDSKHFESPLSR
jgi:hypothetical protein